MKERNILNKLGLLLGFMGALAVILGAFGAHSLKAVLPADRLATYNIGITYHFYHLFAMTFAWFAMEKTASKWAKRSFCCFFVGIILFSGSIYLLGTRDLIGLVNYRWVGPITPIGGVFFILGWIFLGVSFFSKNVD
ncbi:MAG: uncharacterized membrane protein YgdD (TMEM256/DUF423 family) [Saprospiraceae bacterium]|jgi:uncharacterized membrane protein YgdD (TMEM256/DUF423 family)